MDVYFDLKQTASIDTLVSVQAENNQNVWKLSFSNSKLIRFFVDVILFFQTAITYHYARLVRDFLSLLRATICH